MTLKLPHSKEVDDQLEEAGEGVVVRWWDVATGKRLHENTLKGNHHDAAFAPDANLLAVAGIHQPDGENGKSEHVLWLIDVAARKLVRTVGLPSRIGGNNQKVRVSADGKRVFVEFEGDVQVIDGKTGDELIRHKGRINAGTLAASRDGRLDSLTLLGCFSRLRDLWEPLRRTCQPPWRERLRAEQLGSRRIPSRGPRSIP